MHFVCVSRGTFSGGKQLAERLANKLGVPCLGREQVTDAATRAGIPVGKIEMAVMRPRPLTEQLAVERDRYKAFATAALAERALATGVVYHGRTGHLAAPSVAYVLRVRAIMDAENRISLTMRRMGVDRDKARRYNEQVDEDRRRWGRMLYNIDWNDPAHYDVVVSLDHLSADNAAAGLVGVAQLPEFQPTPAARRVLEDLLLASRCRLAIGDDPRTRHADVRVRASAGSVSVTYPPRHENAAAAIPEVLDKVDGISALQCTMASTSILWIEERYDPASPALSQLLEIATKWNAAVGLIRLSTDDAAEPDQNEHVVDLISSPQDDAGILDDTAVPADARDDTGVAVTMSRLLQEGRAGELVQALDRTTAYSLVVVGDVFLNRDASVRRRMTRELGTHVSESLRVPVIATSELRAQYLFQARHAVRMIGLAAATSLCFVLVFRHQAAVLHLLTAPGLGHRVLVTAALAVFVPLYATLYGSFSQYLLRLVKFE
jgi:cytidylate kinase